MNIIGPMIAAPNSLVLAYSERLLNGIKSSDFARFARIGGQTLKSNHAAFVFGHLSIYPIRVFTHLGLPATVAVTVPEKYNELFAAGSECRDDPEGTIYPPMEEITRHFFAGYQAAAGAVAAADDAIFQKPNPAEGRMKELFPTIGAMLGFYLSGHPQVHLGQISAWRRAMGLPPAM